MHGMAEALAILTDASRKGLPVLVYGDYDVDGICACALMTQALRRFGLRADPHTPLREEGYGLNMAAVEQLAKDYRVLVTVDLGITNHEEVRLAQRLGMRVIVTDHHGLGLEESPADAALNREYGEEERLAAVPAGHRALRQVPHPGRRHRPGRDDGERGDR